MDINGNARYTTCRLLMMLGLIHSYNSHVAVDDAWSDS